VAENDVMVHLVELLGVSAARITDGEADGERVVIVTIRPDLPAFRPHNLGILRHQGKRLLEDLQNLLSPVSDSE
jgi:hypothetical protein